MSQLLLMLMQSFRNSIKTEKERGEADIKLFKRGTEGKQSKKEDRKRPEGFNARGDKHEDRKHYRKHYTKFFVFRCMHSYVLIYIVHSV